MRNDLDKNTINTITFITLIVYIEYMQTKQLPFAFRCPSCRIAKVTEGSKIIRFEDGDARVCKGCVEATEYLRSKLPIVGE